VRIVSKTDDAASPALTGEDRAPAPGARTRAPVEVTAGFLRGRWTAPILWHLFWGGKSFYQLLRELDGVSRPVLVRELEEKEALGLVARRVHPGGPVRVEYVLTGLGESLRPVLAVMYEWGLYALDSCAGSPAVEKQRRCLDGEH
jgi:DNA-binding HxlR family transcriptional regulator